MKLTDEQQAKVAEWIEAGASLNDVQERLRTEMDIIITYLETRFLLGDLGLAVKEAADAEPETATPEVAEPEPADEAAPGGVRVEADQIARPGAAISGKVTFGDGQRAVWYLTQYGELGLEPAQDGYQPAEADVVAFQRELQRVLRREGF